MSEKGGIWTRTEEEVRNPVDPSHLFSSRSAAERTFTAKTQSRTTCTTVLGIYGGTIY